MNYLSLNKGNSKTNLGTLDWILGFNRKLQITR